MAKKKSIILIGISTLLIITATVAVSYAYWSVTKVQNTTNVIATGCFNITISEEKNAIKLENTYPITDEKGMQSTPFTFTIRNTCDINAVYTVNLETLAGSDLDTRFIATKVNNEGIKKLGSLTSATLAESDSIESRVIATGSLGPTKSITYDLRVWVDKDVTLNDNAQNKIFNGKIVVVAEAAPMPDPKCIRATTLHTEVHYRTESLITYGNPSVTEKTLNVGDAFTCDVNGDGTYDESTERFYYVSDVYDTVNSTESDLKYDSQTAALIYYNNIYRDNGTLTLNNNAGTAYTTYNGEMAPTIVLNHLPKTSEWSNVSLTNTIRQIRTLNNGLIVNYGSNSSLKTFTYTNSAARLLTIQEIARACDIDNINTGSPMFNDNAMRKCEFLFENTPYALTGLNTYGYWLENYANDNINRAFYIYASNKQITNTYVDYSYPGARPVIEVSKVDIKY